MPERHRAELEAKKAKLEEMRRLREDRRKADQKRQETRVSPPSSTRPSLSHSYTDRTTPRISPTNQ
jgi:hypothetical protein